MTTPSESIASYPDHSWFDGKIASWQNRKGGFVWLFEVIADPTTFKEVVTSSGNPELVKLYEPKPDQVLRLTFLNDDDYPTNKVEVLDINKPSIELQLGDRFIMDATQTTAEGYLAYTCVCNGVVELG